jgi:hypothetical protein
MSCNKLTAGTITSKSISLAVEGGAGDVKIQAGKTDFGDDTAGFILGVDDSDGDKAKFEIGDAGKYLKWNGTDLIIGPDSKLRGADAYSNASIYRYVLYGDPGVMSALGSSGAISQAPGLLNITLAADTNWGYGVNAIGYPILSYAWDNNRKFKTRIYTNNGNSNSIIWVGVGIPGTGVASVNRQVGFKFLNGNLYGYCANGTNESMVLLVSSFGAPYDVSLEFVFTSGSRIDFFVNGNNMGNVTTNLPSGTTHANGIAFIKAYQNGAGSTFLYITEALFLQEE